MNFFSKIQVQNFAIFAQFFFFKRPKIKTINHLVLPSENMARYVSFKKHQMLKTQFFNSSLIWGSAQVHSPELIIQKLLNTDNSMQGIQLFYTQKYIISCGLAVLLLVTIDYRFEFHQLIPDKIDKSWDIYIKVRDSNLIN